MKKHPARISLFIGVLLMVLAAWWQHVTPSARSAAAPGVAFAAAVPVVESAPVAASPVMSRHLPGAPAQIRPEVSPAFAAFNDWTQRYLAQPAARGALLAEGRAMAVARRAELAKLIRTDPRAALAEAVPMVVRQQLPDEILALLEERVSGRGELALYGATPVPGQPVSSPTYRSALIGGQEYRAHVYGRREVPGTVAKTSMNGIALDGHFAVADSPVRVLEPGELAAGRPINEVCDVSGSTTSVAADRPLNATGEPTAIEYDGTIHILCGANHLAAAEARLMAREESAVQTAPAGGPGSSGVAGRPDPAWTHGPKKLLAIRVDFPDLPGTPKDPSGTTITEDYVANVTRTVQAFYADNSFGQTNLVAAPAVNGDSPDVTPVLRLPQPSGYYNGKQDGIDRSGLLHQDARNAAQAAGFNVTGYDRVGVVFSPLDFWWAGLGEIGGRNFWINSYWDLRVVAHEVGHTYGMMHANYWLPPEPYTDAVSLAGTSLEYVDYMDVMGSGGEPKHHFSHWNKSIMQWIPDSSVATIETSGTYRVHRLDDGAANLGLTRALKLRFDDVRDYWISFRGAMTEYNAAHGAYTLWGYHTNQQGNLLNLGAPGSTWTYDAPLPVGASFTDSVNGITMRTLAEGGTGADRWLDIEILFPSAVRWSQTTEYIAGEQEGTARLRLMRYGDTAAAVSVNYATAGGAPENGRATGGQDYVETAGTVSWASGETEDKFITIPIISDSLWEGGERFTVTLTPTGNTKINGAAATTVAILDAGIRDFSFLPDTPWGRVFTAVERADGSVLVGGPFQEVYDQNWQRQARSGFAKLSADGRLQPDFAAGVSGGDGIVRDLVLQPDGRVIVAGSFQFVGTEARANLARLNVDGTLDAAFLASANGPVWAALVQPDGRIVIAGGFTSVNGVPREYLARLNADGTLDAGFTGPDFDGSGGLFVRSLALQADGRILAGGQFSRSNGTQLRSGFCRLLANGAVDPSFAMAQGAHQGGNPASLREVRAILVQPDGRILIGGTFDAYDNAPSGGIARLNADGTPDRSFPLSTDGRCNALMLLPDGRLLVGGWFNQVSGVATKNMAIISAAGAVDANFGANGGLRGELYDFQLLANGRIQLTSDMDNFQFSSEARTLWRMISGLSANPGTVQFAGSTASGAEGANVTLTVSRAGGSSGAVTVGYAATPGTATASDYGTASGTLAWADGDMAAKAITIALASDAVAEPAETFTVSLSNPSGGATLGAATQATVTIQASDGPPPPPGAWTAGDVGVVGAAGSSSESGGVVTVTGSGDDIWNNADAFHFRSQQLTGDGAVVVRVASSGNTHPWAKIGIMFREDLTPGSREVMAFVTPGNASGLQYRLQPGGNSAMGANLWSGMPVWLMLVRSGDTFGGYRSYDGNDWTPLGTINCDLPDTAYIGLAVSSHVRGTILQATFDNVEVIGAQPPSGPPAAPTNLVATGATASTVTIRWTDNASNETGFAIERAPGTTTTFAEVGTVGANTTVFTDAGLSSNTTYTYRVRARRDTLYSSYSNTTLITTNNTPPASWLGVDIGNVGLAGSDSIAEPNITMQAAGTDIWGPADGFRYVYQPWSGDGEIIARVARLDNTHGWAKAGVMFRDTLDANSRNVAYVVTAGANSGLQVRSSAGAETTFTNGPWVNAPYWVKLTRAGNAFTAYTSPDGVVWTQQATSTLSMSTNLYVGVAASSHTTMARTTAAFEYVQVPTGQPPPPPPPPPPGDWTKTTLGNGSGSFFTPSDVQMVAQATGADIWGQADDGLFVNKFWDGADGTMIVRVETLSNTHGWAKAGLMVRENLTAGSRNVFLGLTPGVGATFQVRDTAGGATTEVAHAWTPGPDSYLRLKRTGNSYEAAWSANRSTWTVIGSTTLTLPQGVYVGLGMSSHSSASMDVTFNYITMPVVAPPPPDPWRQSNWGTAQGSYVRETNSTNGTTTFNINATGADIWGAADDAVFINTDWQGAGEIRARIDSLANTPNPWAKAGLMIRAGTGANAANFFVGVTPGAGVVFQVRSGTGATTTEAAHAWGPTAPVWVRLNRNDPAGAHSVTAAYSTDGTNWITLGNVQDLTPNNVQVGVAISSHSSSQAAVQVSSFRIISALPTPP